MLNILVAWVVVSSSLLFSDQLNSADQGSPTASAESKEPGNERLRKLGQACGVLDLADADGAASASSTAREKLLPTAVLDLGIDPRALPEAEIERIAKIGELLRSGPELLTILIEPLPRAIAANDRNIALGLMANPVTSFEALSDPHISVDAFVRRIETYGVISPSALVIAYIYTLRLTGKVPIAPSSLNFHRLFLIAAMLACKYIDDVYYSNAHWARVGGIPLKELNIIEVEALRKLDWKLYVSPQECAHAANMLQAMTEQLHTGMRLLAL